MGLNAERAFNRDSPMRTLLLLLSLTGLVISQSGCDRSVPVADHPAPPAADAPAVVEDAPANPPAAAPAAPPQFPMVEAKFLDKRKALAENPNLREVENRTNASDPFSAAAQSYFTIGSKANLLNFQHNIEIFKAAEGRNPTFEEFNQMFEQFQVKRGALYPWQMYAYDQETGSMSILEDPDEKRRRYEAAGAQPPQ